MTLETPQLYVNDDGGLKDVKNSISKQQHTKIRNVRDMDVLCGRGKLQCSHSGNQSFRKIVQASRKKYVSGFTKSGRARIVSSIIEHFHSHSGRFLQRYGSHWIEMTDKQSRDKVAHAIRDAIKQDGSPPRQFDFSGCCYGDQKLNRQVSDSSDKYKNILAINMFGKYDNEETKFDSLLVSDSEDSSSCSSLSSTTTRNSFQSTYNKPQKSIRDYATADSHNEFSLVGGSNNDDWFLHVIEWTLGESNETEAINLQDVCYNNERETP